MTNVWVRRKLLFSSATDRLSGSHLFMTISADHLNLNPRACMTGSLDINVKREGWTATKNLLNQSVMRIILKLNQTVKPFWAMVDMTYKHLSVLYKQSQSQNFISIHLQTLMVYVGQIEYESQISLEKAFYIVTKVIESFIVLLCSCCSGHGEAV